MDSPRAMSDPGSVSTSSCYFESELRYVEDLSSAFTSLSGYCDGADASTDEVEASPKDSFQTKETTTASLQENCWLQQKRIHKKWETAHEKPGQRGHHAALSAIRGFPDGVGALVHDNASFLVDGIMDEVLGMRDDICKTISFENAPNSDTRAHSVVSEAVETLPEMIQSKPDIHIAAAHQKVADHVFVRAPITSDVLQAARDVVDDRRKHAIHKVVQEDDTSTLVNKAVAETLLRAKAGYDSGAAQGQSLASATLFPEKPSPIGASSFGSIAHPEMCARPCVYFASGTCTKGDSCGFCHLPHDTKVAHLDKKARDQFKTMTLEQRVATCLPVIRQKVIHLRLHHDCVREIDDILMSQPRDAQVGKNIVGQIQRGGSTKFSLRALLGMLKASMEGESVDLQNKLHDLSCLVRTCCAASRA